MSAEENKQVARRFITAFLAGETAVLEELVVEDCVDHNPQPGQKPGRQGLLEILAGWRAAFPDLEATIQHEVAEGEFVVQHGIGSGVRVDEPIQRGHEASDRASASRKARIRGEDQPVI